MFAAHFAALAALACLTADAYVLAQLACALDGYCRRPSVNTKSLRRLVRPVGAKVVVTDYAFVFEFETALGIKSVALARVSAARATVRSPARGPRQPVAAD